MRKCIIWIVLIALIALSCGSKAEGNRLLESLPAGHDIYLTFNPEGIGMQQILEAVDSAFPNDGLQELTDALGFDPMDWNGWREVLSIEAGKEVGIVVDKGVHDVSLVCIYVPSDDLDSVSSTFTSLMGVSGNFRGVLEFREMNDYTIVIIAETQLIADGFEPDIDPLGTSDSQLSRLRSDDFPGGSDAVVYIRFSDIIEDELLDGAVLEMGVAAETLRVQLSFSSSDPDVAEYASIVEPTDPAMHFLVAEGSTGVFRMNLNIEALYTLLSNLGIQREFDQGMDEFGFGSFEEFLNSFTGDLCFCYGTEEGADFIEVQLGLADPDAIAAFIELIPDITGDGEAISEFTLDGYTFFRMGGSDSPRSDTIEYGIQDDVLLFAVGSGISHMLEGSGFEDYIAEYGMGVGPEHCLVFTSDTQLLEDLFGNRIFGMDYGENGIPAYSRAAGYIDTGEGLIKLGLVLESTDENPIVTLFELTGIIMMEAL